MANPEKINSSYRSLLLIIVLLILLSASYWYFFIRTDTEHQSSSSDDQTASLSEQNTGFTQPTEEEKTAGDAQKQANEARQEIDETNTQPTATPFITFAEQLNGNLEVGSFIGGVYEDGGTCELVAIQSEKTVTKTSPSFKNARSTDCQALMIPVSELGAGEWQISIKYTSPTSSGTSEIRKVTIN